MSGKPLSIAMHRALAAVRSKPGLPGEQYPGKWPTIDALRRRRLVHVQQNRDGSTQIWVSEAGNAIHLHSLRTTMHMDGCHWYSTAARCECGATYTHYGERDLKEDPYSAIWMDGDGRDPDEEPCQRCEELMNGARPIYREQLSEPKAKATA
jgi:hypothetical protein